MWPWRKSVLQQEVVLTGWGYVSAPLPDPLHGTIMAKAEDEWFVVALESPVVVDGRERKELRVMARHVGHPLTNVFPGLLRELLLSISVLWRLASPLVAVNVSAERGEPLAIGCIYLRSVWERRPDDVSEDEE